METGILRKGESAMNNLVFLLEEKSSQIMLTAIVPKLVPPEINIRYIPFEGKQDLEKGLNS